MNTHAVLDGDVVFNNGAGADAHVITDNREFAHQGVVTALETGADPRARVNDGVRPDPGVGTDNRFDLAGLNSRRGLADDHVIAEHRPVADFDIGKYAITGFSHLRRRGPDGNVLAGNGVRFPGRFPRIHRWR